jgi:hypothetical protein
MIVTIPQLGLKIDEKHWQEARWEQIVVTIFNNKQRRKEQSSIQRVRCRSQTPIIVFLFASNLNFTPISFCCHPQFLLAFILKKLEIVLPARRCLQLARCRLQSFPVRISPKFSCIVIGVSQVLGQILPAIKLAVGGY